jgi:hypothetical protein
VKKAHIINIIALKEQFKLDDHKHMTTGKHSRPKKSFKTAFLSVNQTFCLSHFSKNVNGMVIKFVLCNEHTA